MKVFYKGADCFGRTLFVEIREGVTTGSGFRTNWRWAAYRGDGHEVNCGSFLPGRSLEFVKKGVEDCLCLELGSLAPISEAEMPAVN